MSISLSTALSGVSAAQERLRASSHNVANLSTPGYRREQVELASLPNEAGVQVSRSTASQPGVSLEKEMVEQRATYYSYVANLRVLETQLNTTGALLDIQA
jgi:flagellar hook-associated protein FlgK